MSAFAVYANIIDDATAMEPDEMFATVGGQESRASLWGGQASSGKRTSPNPLIIAQI